MANNPYAYDLPTSFSNNTYYPYANGGQWPGGMLGKSYDTSNSNDPDVRGAQAAYNQFASPDAGTSRAEQQALLNMYTGRLKTKNALGQEINQNPTLEGQSAENLMNEANNTAAQGVNKTRSNFAQRGLLFSGARQGAEQQVRSNVGSALSSGLSENTRDYTNATEAAKTAYGSVDLANAQQSLDLANQAYATATQNNIARLQAMQQLGGGIGAAAGTIAGNNSYYGTNPTANWSPGQSGYFSGNTIPQLDNTPSWQTLGVGGQ